MRASMPAHAICGVINNFATVFDLKKWILFTHRLLA